MKSLPFVILLAVSIPAAFGAAGSLHLLQKPAMNKTQIVFTYVGDLWSVSQAKIAAHQKNKHNILCYLKRFHTICRHDRQCHPHQMDVHR